MDWTGILSKKDYKKAGIRSGNGPGFALQRQYAENYVRVLQEEMNYRLFLGAKAGEPVLWVEEICLTEFIPAVRREPGMEKKNDNRFLYYIRRFIRALMAWVGHSANMP